MSEWKEYRLGDLIDVKHGFAFKGEFITPEPTIDILVTPGNFNIGGGFKSDRFKFYLGDYPEEYVLKDGDLVVTMTDLSQEGDTLGYSAKIPKHSGKRFLHNQRIGLVNLISDKADKDFIYWVMRTYEYQGFIVGAASGTSIRHTSPSSIKEYAFELPPLREQTAIASILSSLDDKIDLLHRQNKTLEALAETLFRQWFLPSSRNAELRRAGVDEAEEGWKRGTIEDEFSFTMGQSPSGSALNEDGNGMIFFQGRTDFGFRFPEPRVYTTEPTRLAKKFDTLVSVRAPVGDMNMAIEDCCLGRGVAAFRYKVDNSFSTYTYYKLRSLMAQIKQFEDSGTVFGSIGKDDFNKLENVVTPKELVRRFQQEACPLDEKIYLNTIKIRTLTQLRDTLLPKLMSGEIRLNCDSYD
ncbi:MAG: restriction endonuclease subunit S [Bacteroidota bacterium]|nr:restriction endonuclease subunit S [Bacteroidota bacterium]